MPSKYRRTYNWEVLQLVVPTPWWIELSLRDCVSTITLKVALLTGTRETQRPNWKMHRGMSEPRREVREVTSIHMACANNSTRPLRHHVEVARIASGRKRYLTYGNPNSSFYPHQLCSSNNWNFQLVLINIKEKWGTIHIIIPDIKITIALCAIVKWSFATSIANLYHLCLCVKLEQKIHRII